MTNRMIFRACAGLLLLAVTSRAGAQHMTHAELLGKPAATSAMVQCLFDDSVEFSAEYGTASGSYSAQTPWGPAVAAGQPAEAVMTGLTPDTRYFYRVRYRHPGAASAVQHGAAEHTFHTQRKLGSAFTFIVQADPHLDAMSDTALYRRCLQNELADSGDFMIDLGDFLMNDKLANAQKQVTFDTIDYRCHLLRRYYEAIGHSLPLFNALGNHEGEAGWYLNGQATSIPVMSSLERKRYFVNPTPDNFYTGDTSHQPMIGQRGNYFAWTWGDALFIVLDPYYYTNPKPDSLHGWHWSLGKTQYDWLRSTLESSKATSVSYTHLTLPTIYSV